MATRIQITLTADSLSETATSEFQDEFRRFTALHDAANGTLSMLKHMVRWHDQLRPDDIARAEVTIARAEGWS